MRASLSAVALVVGLVVLREDAGFGQTNPAAAPSLEGAWRVSSVMVTGPNAANSIPDRQPNINIWTKKYFSRITADGPTRPVLPPPKDPARLTEAEKLARYEHWNQAGQVVSGAYEIKGTQWFQYALVGKNLDAEMLARNKSGNFTTASTPPAGQTVAFEGNALVLTQMAAGTDGKSVNRRTYVRLDKPRTPGAKPHPIEGAWRGTSTVVTGANPSANPNRQPNMVIYQNGYYSMMIQDGAMPLPPRVMLAPPKDPAKLTDAEKLARYEHWAPLGATSGVYEIKENKLFQYGLVGMTQTADMIARNKSGNLTMATTPVVGQDIAFQGNTLVLTQTSPDGKTVTRRTYTRLE